MGTTERQTYKIAGPSTWELIRAAYLGGDSAPALAERFGVSEHAIRKRITVEGWSKRAFVAALEARGVAPVSKPNFIEEGVRREHMRIAGEATAKAERDVEADAWIAKVAAEEDASDIAAALERRALAQASAALVQGRSKDAQALASLAEQMRKSRGERSTAAPPRGEAESAHGDSAENVALSPEDRAGLMMEIFGRAAYLAAAMVHEPASAPAAFLRMLKRWREINLGEGLADAAEAAARVAASKQHYLDGSWVETTPEDVQIYLKERWDELRAQLAHREP